jgi:hypothetical protein
VSAVDTIDATVVEEHEPLPAGQDLVRRDVPTLAVTPQIKAGELVERLAVIKDAMEKAMVDGVDYGKVPGTDKPTLLKPGAEKLGVLFQLDIQPDCEKTWGPGDHLTVVTRAVAYHAPTGARLGRGEGICTTRERKYAYRKQERTCPTCGAQAIIKGKAEYGGGWVCWKKRGGCDAKFPDGAPEIEGQEAGEIDNPDLPDLWNTVVKMSEKRARIDVVLAVTGASALFTQDLDDQVEQGQQSTGTATKSTPASKSASRVTAPPAARTERMATAKQRGLINGRAAAAGLTSIALANIMLSAAGQEPREFASQEEAGEWLKRQLDRLPGRLVNAVLEGIAQVGEGS